MVRKPMIVDDSMNDDMDDDELDLAEGAAGAVNQTATAAARADGDAPADKKKSVRLAAEGGPTAAHGCCVCSCGNLNWHCIARTAVALADLELVPRGSAWCWLNSLPLCCCRSR